MLIASKFYQILVAWYLCQTTRALTVQQKIAEVIGDLCPNADVCRTNESLPISTFPPGRASCCRECSCSKICNSEDTCCFPTVESREKHRNQMCISRWIPKPLPSMEHFYRSYYMHTDPPPSGCVTATESQVVKNHDVPWGNMSPVSSKYTTNIYLNEKVAACHGEYNVTHWQPIAACKNLDDTNGNVFDMEAEDETLFIFSNESHCSIYFKFPGDANEIETERCFPELISSCPNHPFEIPVGINMSHDEVQLACESQFYSPYTKYANFRNVFCHICNNRRFRKNEECPSDTHTRAPKARGYLTILLDHDVMRNINNAGQTKKTTTPKACPKDTSLPTECRTVLCPHSQLKLENGTCVWPFQALMKDKFGLFLKLIPHIPLPVEQFNRENIEYPSWLKSPWPAAWTVDHIYYQSTDAESPIVKHIWVTQAINWKRRSMETLVRKTGKTLNQRWTALIGNVTIELDQVIDLYKFFDNGHYRFAGSSRHVTDPSVHHLYTALSLFASTIQLTKPYFCDRIELLEDEYTTTRIQESITYIRTNKTLNGAEYSLTRVFEDDYIVKICLEDSGFVLPVSKGQNMKPNFESVLVTFVVTLILR